MNMNTDTLLLLLIYFLEYFLFFLDDNMDKEYE